MTARDPSRFPFVAMGTRCELQLFGDEPVATRAAEAAVAQVHRIERTYSRYRPDSVVAAINEAGSRGGAIALFGEAADLIDEAFDAYRQSGGLFDVTSGVLREVWRDDLVAEPSRCDVERLLARVGLHRASWARPWLTFGRPGMQIDLGGIGKEYAADRAAAVCCEQGISSGLVDLGGDIAAIGPHPDGAPWRIGVRDPADPESALATLFVARGGVATSGDYERFWEFGGRRYGHIFDPRTGWPVRGLSSVTVAAETCLRAGLISTIAMLKGEDGAQWLQEAAAPHIHIDAGNRLGGSVFAPAGDRVSRPTRPPSETAPSDSSFR